VPGLGTLHGVDRQHPQRVDRQLLYILGQSNLLSGGQGNDLAFLLSATAVLTSRAATATQSTTAVA
jgi:hypothetical protein